MLSVTPAAGSYQNAPKMEIKTPTAAQKATRVRRNSMSTNKTRQNPVTPSTASVSRSSTKERALSRRVINALG